MNNRLKLYDDKIYTYLDHCDKIKFRKIAFKHKKTVSEFNRDIILLIIKLCEMDKLNSQLELNEQNVLYLLNMIGGNLDRQRNKK